MSEKKYYVGFDIGTTSVGWAVTDENYELVNKKHGKLWGVNLFQEASTQEGRRLARSARRRLKRRKWRLTLLKDLMKNEVSKVDPTFFKRMEESVYWLEDRELNNVSTLFNDPGFKDRQFYGEFKTIYHLRKHLLETNDRVDIRYLYLVLHHMIKYRGHFLFPELNVKIGSETNLTTNLREGLEKINNLLIDSSTDPDNPLKFEISESELDRIIQTNHKYHSKVDLKREYKLILKPNDSSLGCLAELLAGSKTKISGLWKRQTDDDDVSFSLDMEEFDTKVLPLINGMYGDVAAEVVYELKLLFDLLKMDKLLVGSNSISSAMVKRFEDHKKQLNELKKYVRKYLPEKYDLIFNDYEKHKSIYNYSSYVGYAPLKKGKWTGPHCNRVDFYKFLKKELSLPKTSAEFAKLEQNYSDESQFKFLKRVLELIENNDYLPRQNSSDNGVFPYQLNLAEMDVILRKQSKHYPFLLEESKYGTVLDKIESILKFKIPYYIGPLVENPSFSNFGWVVRKNNEHIYPWNFNEVVDHVESAKAFIIRMTNHCTYIPSEFVLPKNSLLFSEYILLNELNKIKINGEEIKMEARNGLLELYKEKGKLSSRQILDYLKEFYASSSIEVSENIKSFTGTMQSHKAFRRIFGDQFKNNYVKIEQIIMDLAVFEEKSILEERLRNFHNLDEMKVQAILKLNFKGWGSISRYLLEDIKAEIPDHSSKQSIMYVLRNFPLNFMEIVASRGSTFAQEIEKYNDEHTADCGENLYENLLGDSYLSPSVKRSVWQTIRIFNELKEICARPSGPHKAEITKIFIEVNREHQEKKETDSRGKQVKFMLEEAKKIVKEANYQSEIERLLSELVGNEDKMKRKKLYLYFQQLGRCAYSGNKIDISTLLTSSNAYDVDHIIPRQILKDDSFENLVLCENQLNKLKSNIYPIPGNVLSQEGRKHLDILLKTGAISRKKYDKITRRAEIEEKELEGFVNRQLVSTNQAVKEVIRILKVIAPECEIVYSKSGNVSEFRNHFKIFKCRDANNVHHAHDAYLNIVVGDTFRKRFGNYYFGENKTRGYILDWHQKKFSLQMDALFPVNNERSDNILKRVEKNLAFKNVIMSRKLLFKSGKGNQLMDQNILSPKDPSNNNLYPIKTKNKVLAQTEKYGGYSSLRVPFYTLIKIKNKNKIEYRIIGVPLVYHLPAANVKEACILAGYSDFEIIIPKIPVMTLIEKNGALFNVSGMSKQSLIVWNATELYFDNLINGYLKVIHKIMDKDYVGRGAAKEIESMDTDRDNRRDTENISFNKITRAIIDALHKNSSQKLEKNENIVFEKEEILKLINRLLLRDIITKISSLEQFKSIASYQNIVSKIEESIPRFDSLNLHEQFRIIINVLKVFGAGPSRADLSSFLANSKEVGKLVIPQNLTSGTIIYRTSVTGYYRDILWKYPEE